MCRELRGRIRVTRFTTRFRCTRGHDRKYNILNNKQTEYARAGYRDGGGGGSTRTRGRGNQALGFARPWAKYTARPFYKDDPALARDLKLS